MAAYFQYYQVLYKECTGEPHHVSISATPNPRCEIDLTSDDHTLYSGRFSEWFKSFTSPNPALQETTCWMALDGSVDCPGTASLRRICVMLPVVLIVSNPEGAVWDFPAKLVPSLATRKGLKVADLYEKNAVYRLVGRALHTPRLGKNGHFIARFCDASNQVFTYDGLSHGGRSQLQAGGKVKKFLSGSQPMLPDGYTTTTVVYVLEGRTDAQEWLYTQQLLALQREHKISATLTPSTPLFPGDLPDLNLVRPGFTLLPDSDRFWFKPGSRNLKKTKDYRHQKAKSNAAQGDDNVSSPISPETTPALPEADDNIFSPISPETSPVVPEVAFRCRCGAESDHPPDGMAVIRCAECHVLSHKSCRWAGNAGGLSNGKQFLCDACTEDLTAPSKRLTLRNSDRLYVQSFVMATT